MFLRNWFKNHDRWTPHHWPATAVLPTVVNTFGATLSVNGAAHIIDCTAVPGTNKIVAIGENPAASTDRMPSYRDFNYQEFSCSWDRTNDLTGSTGNYTGVRLGFAAYPYVAAPVTPVIEARWLDAAPFARLYTAVGDGVTPGATVDATGLGLVGYEGRMWVKVTLGVSVEFWGLDRDAGAYRLLCAQRDPTKMPAGPLTKGWQLVVASGAVAAGMRVVYSPPTLLVQDL